MADTGNYPDEWDADVPDGDVDVITEADDELRLIKKVVNNATMYLGSKGKLDQSLFEAMFPQGALSPPQTHPTLGNPGDDIGGTWIRYADITGHTPDTTDGAKTMYVFIRTA